MMHSRISLEIGVALPYIENSIEYLLDYELLRHEGRRYTTNIIIIMCELADAISVKTSKIYESPADKLESLVRDSGDKIRAIGFHGSDMSKNEFTWHVVSHALRYCFNSVPPSVPLSLLEDVKGWYWGSEDDLNEFAFLISGYNTDSWLISFIEYICNGDKITGTFFGNSNTIRLFAEIAAEHSKVNGINDEFIAAEMVKQNIIHADKNGLFTANAPVYTSEQFARAFEIMKPYILSIIDDHKDALRKAELLMEDHVPTHLKSSIPAIAYIETRQKLMSETVRILWERGFLHRIAPYEIMATTYTKLP